MKKTLVAGTLVAAVAVGGFSLGRLTQLDRVQAEPPPQSAPASPAGLPSFASLAPQVSPAVVHIKVVGLERTDFQPGGPRFRSPFPRPQPRPQRGSGSGFIVRQDGLILTNNHVVENAKRITVVLADETEYQAELLGGDAKTDLAVLKITPTAELPVAQLGDSDGLRVGDWVLAIGNPFGLSNTVTAGIVSATGRAIGAGPYDNFIQTDASINPGNSGGPLFNQAGQVVGINTAIFSRSGGNIGIGFATPINQAKALMPALEEHGYVTRGWLGVSIQNLTRDLAASLGLDAAGGALVADVVNAGPAQQAGIRRGDVILGYNGQEVTASSDLPILVAETRVGETVAVELSRRGRRQTLSVTIGELAEERRAGGAAVDQSAWGLAVRELRPQERAQAGLDADEGVLVSGVRPGSPAARARLRSGDVILEVNRTPVGSVQELQTALATAQAGRPLLVLLQRPNGASRFASLSAE